MLHAAWTEEQRGKMAQKTPVLVGVGAMGLFLFFILKEPKTKALPAVLPELPGKNPAFDLPPLVPGSTPILGRLWRWADNPLPILRESKESGGRFWGVYSPNPPFKLIAVFDSLSTDGQNFEIVSITPVGEFGATFK